MISFTVVVAHFGDPFWVNQVLRGLSRQMDRSLIQEVVVIDQDRSHGHLRLDIPIDAPSVRIVEFPVDEDAIARVGHDHGESIDRALGGTFKTTHVLVMDSDLIMLTTDAIQSLALLLMDWDCVMARDHHKFGLSHPCLVAVPTAIASSLNFTEGLRELGIDTGRLVALQASQQGRSVMMLDPGRAFNGLSGHTFLHEKFLHFGSGSFVSSSDERLRRQVDQRRIRLLMKCIVDDPPRVELRPHEYAAFLLYAVSKRILRLRGW